MRVNIAFEIIEIVETCAFKWRQAYLIGGDGLRRGHGHSGPVVWGLFLHLKLTSSVDYICFLHPKSTQKHCIVIYSILFVIKSSSVLQI